MKVVINKKHGGFDLSDKAVLRYAELVGLKLYSTSEHGLYNHYTLVPWKEYEKIHHEESQRGRFDKSNKLYFSTRAIERDDPVLVQVVEELGKEANGKYAKLKIVEIPDDVEYIIQEYDGLEWIAEKHRTWE